MKTYSKIIRKLNKNQIFCFGANTQFRHGKGSALKALKFGAEYGRGGYVGQTYAIVTKDLTKNVHPSISKNLIINQIKILYDFAKSNPEKEFLIAYMGNNSTNLSGYTNLELAEMFSSHPIPTNIIFEYEFSNLLPLKNLKSSLF